MKKANTERAAGRREAAYRANNEWGRCAGLLLLTAGLLSACDDAESTSDTSEPDLEATADDTAATEATAETGTAETDTTVTLSTTGESSEGLGGTDGTASVDTVMSGATGGAGNAGASFGGSSNAGGVNAGGSSAEAGGGGASGSEAGSGGVGVEPAFECAAGEYVCGEACCSWQIEQVGEAGQSGPASIAVGPANDPHFVFQAGLAGVQYATRAGDEWQLDPVGSLGLVPSLAIDAAGQPHVALIDQTALDSRGSYATRVGETWAVTSVTEHDYTEIRVAQGGSGGPHFCYVNALRELWTASPDGVGFTETRLCPSCGIGDFACAVNQAGTLQVIWDQDGWQTSPALLAPPMVPFSFIRIAGAAFDAEDRFHIVYQDGTLKWAVYDGQAWASSDTGESAIEIHPAMTLDTSGLPHLVYFTGQLLRHARFDGTSWRFSTVSDRFYLGQPDIAVGADGVVHIVYYNSNAQTLHYARTE